MKYLKQFIEEAMHVSPMGKADWADGMDEGQYELLVDGKETGIYFMAYDYANWLEKKLNGVLQVEGNASSTVGNLQFIYDRMQLDHQEDENIDYMRAFERIINTIKQFEA